MLAFSALQIGVQPSAEREENEKTEGHKAKEPPSAPAVPANKGQNQVVAPEGVQENKVPDPTASRKTTAGDRWLESQAKQAESKAAEVGGKQEPTAKGNLGSRWQQNVVEKQLEQKKSENKSDGEPKGRGNVALKWQQTVADQKKPDSAVKEPIAGPTGTEEERRANRQQLEAALTANGGGILPARGKATAPAPAPASQEPAPTAPVTQEQAEAVVVQTLEGGEAVLLVQMGDLQVPVSARPRLEQYRRAAGPRGRRPPSK
eukprot:TRINITY_DN2493_c0_g1_i2.p1 TRINITY_DN2493_c0_g1~~TRINITY_DN2493_c0_g1_i2.p1  ORF type:complete len:261 (+),score=50.79 TRINITY_DN2493_c0_g1_i2:645-1427(+)